jgi:hypothetical protein
MSNRNKEYVTNIKRKKHFCMTIIRIVKKGEYYEKKKNKRFML